MSSNKVRKAGASQDTHMQTFLEEIFRPLNRAEQRRWARTYMQALLHASGKKTPRRMARTELLPPSATHGLHQFINASPWEWEPVRRMLALQVAANEVPYAWAIAELIIPKRGEHSVGVHRRLDNTTGQTVNCQHAVVLFLAAGAHCFPVDWALMLDDTWDRDRYRRLRARVPDAETARHIDAGILDYATDVAAQPRLPRVPWALDLTQWDDASRVLTGLARRRLDVVCEVAPGQVVLTGHRNATATLATVGQLMKMRYSHEAQVMVHRRPDGRSTAMPILAYAGTVRLPQRGIGRYSGTHHYRLLALQDPAGRRPTRYWITDLTDRSTEEILALMRSRPAVRSAVATLRDQFGVLDFAGRSYPGWHHHMTMASAAYVYQHLYNAPHSLAAAPVTAAS